MLKLTLLALLVAGFTFQVASAQDLGQMKPYVNNMEKVNAEVFTSDVDSRLDQLSDAETNQLDQITSAAAARAVLALRCEAHGFERISKSIQRLMESKVGQVSSNIQSARAYARDSALMKYKAIAKANSGVACVELDNLRRIAESQGFD